MMTQKSKNHNVISSALKTISIEQAGLNAIHSALNSDLAASFSQAVDKILQAKGRVIVTGLGKSGHVGTKIAATFASTGTAAHFVHASEANHGDLGMIGKDDVILALSWSGETAELSGILSHAARFKIPLIALTSGKKSALGRAADIIILLPKVEEACPHGLAPTTSTTMQLALGDALAVALLEMRGFTASDFKTYHPGGSLGAQLKYVRDIMHVGDVVPIVRSGTNMATAMQVLVEKHFGCVAVVDDKNTLLGIITDGDLARNSKRDISKLAVEAIMTKNPKTVKPDNLAASAMAMINEYKIGALLVVEDKQPVGIIHIHDLLRIGTA